MANNYKAIWLPTGQEIFYNAANLELAWQKAIELFKEAIIRQMLPSFVALPDHLDDIYTKDSSLRDTVPTFKQISAKDLISVEPLNRIKVSLFRDGLTLKTETLKDNPLKWVKSVEPSLPESYNLDVINSWITEQILSETVSYVIFDYTDEKGEGILEGAILSVRIEKV